VGGQAPGQAAHEQAPGARATTGGTQHELQAPARIPHPPAHLRGHTPSRHAPPSTTRGFSRTDARVAAWPMPAGGLAETAAVAPAAPAALRDDLGRRPGPLKPEMCMPRKPLGPWPLLQRSDPSAAVGGTQKPGNEENLPMPGVRRRLSGQHVRFWPAQPTSMCSC
jgi:hypothetical protein